SAKEPDVVVSLQERRIQRSIAGALPAGEKISSEPSQSGGLSEPSATDDGRGPPNRGGDGPISLDRELARLPCTDLGNVQRFFRRHGHRAAFRGAFSFWVRARSRYALRCASM